MSDDNKKSAKAEPSISESVAARIKSRHAKPVILDGKASKFEISRYGGHDYKAGGLLSPRLVRKDDARFQELMAEGYDFPSAWDPRLPDLEFSGLKLMMRSNEHSQEAQGWHLKNAEALDRSKAPSDHAKTIEQEQRQGAQFFGEKPTKENVVLTAENKVRSMGPE